MLIDEFVDDTKNHLDDFKKYWKENNKEDPVGYPLSLSENNKGLWMELFMSYLD